MTSHLTNINLYVTAGGVSKSMAPHNDIQCTLIVQLEGRKRWRRVTFAICRCASDV